MASVTARKACASPTAARSSSSVATGIAGGLPPVDLRLSRSSRRPERPTKGHASAGPLPRTPTQIHLQAVHDSKLRLSHRRAFRKAVSNVRQIRIELEEDLPLLLGFAHVLPVGIGEPPDRHAEDADRSRIDGSRLPDLVSPSGRPRDTGPTT